MIDHRPRAFACVCALLIGMMCARHAAADEPRLPLHERVDRMLDADRIGPPTATAGDAEFFRRVSIDLIGMPPSTAELRSFLDDRDSQKRARAVDRLLASPLFARQWATTLDVMLMERRANEQVPDAEWQAYLLDAARRNRSFPELVGELLRADGGDPKSRVRARFYLDRESEPNRIARDVGRIFFGRDLQCAQCHNHPLIDDYRQSDYQGLLAFFSPGSELVKMEGTKKTTFFPEKAARDVAFDSVFVKDDHHLTGPRLPGAVELDEPAVPPGDEYQVKAAGFVMPVPRHSRRAMLATIVAGGGNRAFNENLANRLWAFMMGRGLVHPVDLTHPANPPVHPELLAMLGREIAALKFDVKPFLRELAMTRAYQGTIDLPEQLPPLPASFGPELEEQKSRTTILEAEVERATEAFRKAEKAWHRAEATLIPIAAEEDKAVTKLDAVLKKEEEARAALAAAEAAVAARRDSARALAEASARALDVIKKLPKEKDLADAARIFAKRSEFAANELVAMEKAGGEKAAALKKIGEERAAVARNIVETRGRIRPVRETVRREEAAVLAARGKRSECRTALENHQRRIATLEAYARWHRIQEQIGAGRRQSESLASALGAARTRSAEQSAAVRSKEREARTAERLRSAGEKTMADAGGAVDHYQKASKGVESALAATKAAQALLPGDAELEGAVATLERKVDHLHSALTGLQATSGRARDEFNRASERARLAGDLVKAATTELRRLDEDVRTVRAKIDATNTRIGSLRSELAAASDELTSLLGNRFAMGLLKPLTPEQLYWSTLKVTGVYDRTREAQEAELEAAKRLVGAAFDVAVDRRAWERSLEQRTHDKLKSGVTSFIGIYGAGPGQPQGDFFATADQALFASNGGSINGWIAPGGGNITQRMIAEKDVRKAAGDLYRTILSRAPSDEEAADVARMLAVPEPQKPAVVQELVWGLLTSVEFRFNH